MIISYSKSTNGDLKKSELQHTNKISLKGITWFDLLEPSIEEEGAMEKLLGIDMPTREEIDKLEVANPFYKIGNSYYMTITVINSLEFGYPESSAITFILTPQCLVTLRYSRPKAFSSMLQFMKKKPWPISSPDAIMENIIEVLITNIADFLEKSGNELDILLLSVFESSPMNSNTKRKHNVKKVAGDKYSNYYNETIKKIGSSGNLISKSRESLMSINKMLVFFGQVDGLSYIKKNEHRVRLRNISREVTSLYQYVDFLSQRNSFLLNATLGMINVEQNMIIKVFTVAATIFLPPTLIASIYGMNFKSMPELAWDLGYPIAVVMMLLSALAPYGYFKRKGWI